VRNDHHASLVVAGRAPTRRAQGVPVQKLVGSSRTIMWGLLHMAAASTTFTFCPSLQSQINPREKEEKNTVDSRTLKRGKA